MSAGTARSDSPTSCYQAAAEYAENNWAVFPTKGKVPILSNGFKGASTDAGLVAEWWTTNPEAGIGSPVPVGEFVLDVDPRNGGDETFGALIREHGPLPATLKSKTGGGGFHLWFGLPKGVDADRLRSTLGKGLDVKLGGKGYVILPPSSHESGKRDAWEPYCDPENQKLRRLRVG